MQLMQHERVTTTTALGEGVLILALLGHFFCIWSSQQPHKTQQNDVNMYYVYAGIGREFTKLPQS
jgi:hypothetical protein